MPDTKRIRELNDDLRVNLTGGRIAITPGVMAQGDLAPIIEQMRRFTDFEGDNDPYGEHDMGSFKVKGADGLENNYLFVINYYDPDLMLGSSNPAEPAITARVLTLMLAEEY